MVAHLRPETAALRTPVLLASSTRLPMIADSFSISPVTASLIARNIRKDRPQYPPQYEGAKAHPCPQSFSVIRGRPS